MRFGHSNLSVTFLYLQCIGLLKFISNILISAMHWSLMLLQFHYLCNVNVHLEVVLSLIKCQCKSSVTIFDHNWSLFAFYGYCTKLETTRWSCTSLQIVSSQPIDSKPQQNTKAPKHHTSLRHCCAR